MTKRCFRCGLDKPLSEFYPHPEMADGHLNKCKQCTRNDVRRNRMVRRQHYREYERRRFLDPRRQQQIAEMIERRRQRHPEKERARNAVSNALRDGRLQRQPCQVCGNPESEAHHPDYSRPLDVVWLCFTHHREAHGQTVPSHLEASAA